MGRGTEWADGEVAMAEPIISTVDIIWAVFTVSLACVELLVALIEERHKDDWSLA